MPQFDAFIPQEMAKRAEKAGVSKANLPALKTFVLAVLAGAFIGLGAMLTTVTTTGLADAAPFGAGRLLAGLVFSLGLVLVVVAGAELFTGNNLVVMAVASRRVSYMQLARNWAIVYAGNFAGCMATAGLVFLSGQHRMADGAVGENAVAIAAMKCQIDFIPAVVLGILCNALVCLAVWLSFSARSTTDRILSVIFPVTTFVAAGFEHSVANMYFIPMGLFICAAHPEVSHGDSITWFNFLVGNLLPVTLGNIVGGSLLVGIVYWFIYLRPSTVEEKENAA